VKRSEADAPLLNTTLPLWMQVETLSHPSPENIARSSCIGSLFFPPTLIPRSSATCVIIGAA
jgi:hypothetical protein